MKSEFSGGFLLGTLAYLLLLPDLQRVISQGLFTTLHLSSESWGTKNISYVEIVVPAKRMLTGVSWVAVERFCASLESTQRCRGYLQELLMDGNDNNH